MNNSKTPVVGRIQELNDLAWKVRLELDAANRRIKELEDILRPLAVLAKRTLGPLEAQASYRDESEVPWTIYPGALTFGDLRRARDMLARMEAKYLDLKKVRASRFTTRVRKIAQEFGWTDFHLLQAALRFIKHIGYEDQFFDTLYGCPDEFSVMVRKTRKETPKDG